MWLLTTRNRPEMCQRMLDACIDTGVTTPGLVWMDGCDYGSLRRPDSWKALPSEQHRNIGAALRMFFRAFPDLPWYGWLADDIVPITSGWDRKLVEAAGSKYVAYANDNWQQGVKERDGTPHITSAVCLGGDFVRAMGMLALPGQVQMYIDDVWESLAVPAGLMTYLPEVIVEHHHFANGKRQADATDTREFNGGRFPSLDRQLFFNWLDSPDFMDATRRVTALVRSTDSEEL